MERRYLIVGAIVFLSLLAVFSSPQTPPTSPIRQTETAAQKNGDTLGQLHARLASLTDEQLQELLANLPPRKRDDDQAPERTFKWAPSRSSGQQGEVVLPPSQYDPEHPWRPTTYQRPRAVNTMLRRFGFKIEEGTASAVDGIPNAVVIEVGAFDGVHTAKFAAKPNLKTIYSFEVTPSKMPTIEKNIEAHRHKVKLFNAGATDHQGTMTLNVVSGPGVGGQQDGLGPQDFWKLNEGQKVEKVLVNVTRLDEVVHEHVHYLKTDTQGNEFHVLRGAEKLIDKYGVDHILLEYIPTMAAANGENLGDLLHYLHDKGYTCFDNGDASFALDWQQDYSYDRFPHLIPTNTRGFHGEWMNLNCFKFA